MAMNPIMIEVSGSPEYVAARLVVWPDWGSSGIWHPKMGSEIGMGPLIMVEHSKLGIPDYLSEAFDMWIRWYDEYLPENPDQFPWKEFGERGLDLALTLYAKVEGLYRVEYDGKQVIAFV